ncbi:glutamyl-tRNA synthetase-like protein [Cercophora scortea]|uniref:Glutamate--tRNA ligase, mitochondrial n=1 Tax=Cercophora scortea TaxID=314031 RepID=A0AAE0IYH5_9PEZI|nr:glutamyl-tRNA synthetase-like protein [Cercophora scortea]
MRGIGLLRRAAACPSCGTSCRALPSTRTSVSRFSSSPRLWFSSTTRVNIGDPPLNVEGRSPAMMSGKERRWRAVHNRAELPKTPCRTRFAPSPTGYLHLGSLRTALFNYLIAKATGGQFILRVEDTDQTRLVPDAEERLFADLKWAGLSWDEGPDVKGLYGPYRQSERLDIYNQHTDKLIEQGAAYRCFCSPEDLDAHQRAAHTRGGATAYPGTCRSISPAESEERAARGDPFAVRFKSSPEPVVAQDIVFNRFQKAIPEEDFVIRKRDGYPTYHFANVIDDKLMEITHVVRGSEWLVSTPKHVELYNAFGWTPPQFAHVGLLVNSNREKLSKRHDGVNMTWYQDQNILPATLLNFAALLGWHSTRTNDVMTLQDLVKNFTFNFSRGDIIVSFDKLRFLQEKHMRLLIDKDPPDAPLLSQYLLRPMVTSIVQAEARRVILPPTASPYAKPPVQVESTPDSGSSNTAADLLDNISAQHEPTPVSKSPDPVVEEPFAGPLVPALQSSQPVERLTYLLAVLRATRLPDPDIAEYILKNKYLFWKIRKATLSQEWDKARKTFKRVTLNGVLTPPRDISKFLVARFGSVPEQDWTLEVLGPLIKTTVQQIQYLDLKTDAIVPNGGYLFLRIALQAMLPGPAISQVMLTLGRHETMCRLIRLAEVFQWDVKSRMKPTLEETIQAAIMSPIQNHPTTAAAAAAATTVPKSV